MRAPHPWLGHEKLQRPSRWDGFFGPLIFIAWFVGALGTLAGMQFSLKVASRSIRGSKIGTRVHRAVGGVLTGPPDANGNWAHLNVNGQEVTSNQWVFQAVIHHAVGASINVIVLTTQHFIDETAFSDRGEFYISAANTGSTFTVIAPGRTQVTTPITGTIGLSGWPRPSALNMRARVRFVSDGTQYQASVDSYIEAAGAPGSAPPWYYPGGTAAPVPMMVDRKNLNNVLTVSTTGSLPALVAGEMYMVVCAFQSYSSNSYPSSVTLTGPGGLSDATPNSPGYWWSYPGYQSTWFVSGPRAAGTYTVTLAAGSATRGMGMYVVKLSGWAVRGGQRTSTDAYTGNSTSGRAATFPWAVRAGAAGMVIETYMNDQPGSANNPESGTTQIGTWLNNDDTGSGTAHTYYYGCSYRDSGGDNTIANPASAVASCIGGYELVPIPSYGITTANIPPKTQPSNVSITTEPLYPVGSSTKYVAVLFSATPSGTGSITWGISGGGLTWTLLDSGHTGGSYDGWMFVWVGTGTPDGSIITANIVSGTNGTAVLEVAAVHGATGVAQHQVQVLTGSSYAGSYPVSLASAPTAGRPILSALAVRQSSTTPNSSTDTVLSQAANSAGAVQTLQGLGTRSSGTSATWTADSSVTDALGLSIEFV